MAEQRVRVPGPDQPITIEPDPDRVVVRAGGRIVADTRRALIVREANYPPVRYVPREDVDMALLEPSATSSHCPYKGDASYFTVPAGGPQARDAAWSYEAPHPAVAPIAGHLAFYPDRVDAIETGGSA